MESNANIFFLDCPALDKGAAIDSDQLIDARIEKKQSIKSPSLEIISLNIPNIFDQLDQFYSSAWSEIRFKDKELIYNLLN